MTKEDIIAKLMRMTWSSLESHLPYISTRKDKPYIGNRNDQKKIIKEYIEQFNLLSKLL
ncbi:MAG: hypothetical protein WCN88_04735 [Candidatus Falkowbacteria bacterium]